MQTQRIMNKLCSLLKSKHTLRLKNNNHRHAENILCTLGESHTVGRVDLQRDERTLIADPERYIRFIDIQTPCIPAPITAIEDFDFTSSPIIDLIIY